MVNKKNNKLNIPEDSHLTVKWKVLPIDYNEVAKSNIISRFSKKYGVPKDRITIEPVFIHRDKDGNIDQVGDEPFITDMRDPLSHKKLYDEYLTLKEITDYDKDRINAIDDLINSKIDYEHYDNYKKYTLKWIKWSNFMSYGEDNFFDFTKLHGITLLQSEPANQGGKSTFCLDLFRFLLYGKVACREDDWVLASAFNLFLPEATEMVVEGCIESEGNDYVIKRTLTRPALKKRSEKSKVTQKVNYYRLVNGSEYIDLIDENDIEHAEGLTNVETNRIIKEIIGNENDFDLMICVNDDNLKDLIKLKDTERGRLLSRWVGLLPLEEKDKIAREMFNKQVMPSLMLNKYNREDLKNEIDVRIAQNEEYQKQIEILTKRVDEAKHKLEEYQKSKENLLESKNKIDDTLMKVDVVTLQKSISDITEKGKIKRAEKEKNEKELAEFGEVEYEESEYQDVIVNDKRISTELSVCTNNYKRLLSEIEGLKKSEYCPTCGQRLQNVDNSEMISKKESERDSLVEKGKALRKESVEAAEKKALLEQKRLLVQKRSKLQLLIATNDADINRLLVEYREKVQLMKDIEANKAAIEQNNKIELSLNILNENIRTEERIILNSNNDITSYKNTIETNERDNKKAETIIETIIKEEKEVKNWRIYLDLVGKNGVCKMVLRNALPLINGELERMLNGVCDFRVTVEINDKNDVEFFKIHDGVKAKLGSGSGFEQTVASLALRAVLGKISTFSKPSFIVFDEVLGAIANVNYDLVKLLYEKIIKDYQFVFFITHNDVFKEWANNFVTIQKDNNVSKIISSID